MTERPCAWNPTISVSVKTLVWGKSWALKMIARMSNFCKSLWSFQKTRLPLTSPSRYIPRPSMQIKTQYLPDSSVTDSLLGKCPDARLLSHEKSCSETIDPVLKRLYEKHPSHAHHFFFCWKVQDNKLRSKVRKGVSTPLALRTVQRIARGQNPVKVPSCDESSYSMKMGTNQCQPQDQFTKYHTKSHK